MKWKSRAGFLLLCCVCTSGTTEAQTNEEAEEIPIEKCDVLPLVRVKAGATEMRFLLDTGATTILNLGSFAAGKAKDIEVTSWKGTAETSAKEVHISELWLGTHELKNLRLPAIDLSPLTKACGKQIDGIFGVDLMDKMGVTINLKRQVASMGPEEMDAPRLYQMMETSMHRCSAAFEQGEVKVLEDCFDPEIVFYTPDGEYRGKEEVIAYLKKRFMKYSPQLQYRMTLKDVKSFGDALWYSYDYSIDSPKEHMAGHGMSMCRRDKGTWRVLNLHNSLLDTDAAKNGTAKNLN